MKIKKTIKDKLLLFLIFIITGHIIINLIWLKRDSFPLWFDYGGYFKRSMEIFFASQKGFVDFIHSILGIGEYKNVFLPYRIFLPLSTFPWYYFFGLSVDVAVMSCTLFLAITLFFTYKTGSIIFDKFTGFFAAFILSVSPGFFIFYRRYSPEFAVTAIVTAAAYFLLRSQNFQNKGYSLLFGIAFGISMITKEMGFAFIFPLLIYVICKAELFFGLFRSDYLNKRKNILINLIISLVITGAIALPFYCASRSLILHEIFRVAYSSAMRYKYGVVSAYSLEGLTFYIRAGFTFSFLYVNSLFFLCGIWLCFKKSFSNKGFLFSWLFGSYIMLCSTQIKIWEYAIPLLIPISLIASFGVINIFRGRVILKSILVTFVFIIGVLQLFVYSFHIGRLGLARIIGSPSRLMIRYYPRKENWRLDEIVLYIKDNMNDKNKTYYAHVGANLCPFSSVTLGYTAFQKRIKLIFSGYSLDSELVTLNKDFVIVKDGGDQGYFYSLKDAYNLIAKLQESGKFIKLPRIFGLPDGSLVEIYKRHE